MYARKEDLDEVKEEVQDNLKIIVQVQKNQEKQNEDFQDTTKQIKENQEQLQKNLLGAVQAVAGNHEEIKKRIENVETKVDVPNPNSEILKAVRSNNFDMITKILAENRGELHYITVKSALILARDNMDISGAIEDALKEMKEEKGSKTSETLLNTCTEGGSVETVMKIIPKCCADLDQETIETCMELVDDGEYLARDKKTIKKLLVLAEKKLRKMNKWEDEDKIEK